MVLPHQTMKIRMMSVSNEMGYHNKNNTNLSGFLKIKLRGAGLRIVYKLVRMEHKMLIIVIGAREEEEAYGSAYKRIQKHGL